jgi:hypothetical protein
MEDLVDELKRTIEVYKMVIKHLESHLREKYDEMDAHQSKILKSEVRRIKRLLK